MTEPTPPSLMSDARLDEIRESVNNITARGRYSGAVSPSEVIYMHDVSALLAEIDRLRANEAAMRESLPRFLYPFEKPYTCDPCPWCHCSQDYEPHADDCPVTKARALLAHSG